MPSRLLPHHCRLVLAAALLILSTLSHARQVPPAARGPAFRDTFRVSSADSLFTLSHEFVLPGTEAVLLDSIPLRSGAGYTLDARSGQLTLHRAEPPAPGTHTLTVSYRALPLSFKRVYSHREVPPLSDSAGVRHTAPAGSRSAGAGSGPSFFDGIFGPNLQKSGSIVRGFTVGSNRDLSLTSGFRMQMSGSLSRELEVVAALTDENSPIQPEGTTRTLQEVDKVFVELRGTDLSATLGDFNLGLSGNEFGRVNRKLQGAKGTGSYRAGSAEGELLLTGAVARGKFATGQFDGQDGVQGPYRLTGENNERDILVIAGTERVYVNGERMTRGETADYVIDYASAEVTFSPGRFISRASRIVVDFEYTDRRFSRSFVAGRSGTSFFDRRLVIGAEVLAENDDQDSPIDVTLADSDKAILRAAGNDRMKAVRPGAVVSGAGKGQYVRIDTTVATPAGADTAISVYRFAPFDSLHAIYSVTFSFVGQGNGAYISLALGRFQFVGLGQGSYAPVRFLPMPSAHRLVDISVGARPADRLTIGGEYALSTFDANRFSSIGDDQNTGPAASFNLGFNPDNVRVGGLGLGSFDLHLAERFVDRRFVSADRVNEIEFNRKWNIADSSSRDEELREGSLAWRPLPALLLGGGLGWMKRGDPFLSNRSTASASLGGETGPRASYNLEVIRSRDSSLDDRSTWIRHQGSAAYPLGKLAPAIAYSGEVLRSMGLGSGALTARSVRFNEIAPRLALDSVGPMAFRAEVGWRWEDSVSSGSLVPASNSVTQRYGWQVRDWNDLSSTLDLTFQQKNAAGPFRRPGGGELRNILLRSDSRFNPLRKGIETDLLYEISTEQSAKLERIYQQVQKGAGNYIYLGDVNGNHLVDDQDFRLSRFDGDYISVTVPSDNLTPVVGLKAGTRLRLNGSRLFAGGGWPGTLLGALSTETYARVDEKSSEADKKQIYLLHFSHFLSPATTIEGSNLFSQDLYIMENGSIFSLRLRYSQRKGLTEYDSGEERTLSDERSIRLRWQLVKEFSNQTDLIQKKDILGSPQGDYRVRSILSRSLESDWSYRPEQKVELGFKVTVGEAANFDTTRAGLNSEAVRTAWSLSEKGRLQGEFTREEVLLTRAGGFVPFELTGGKVAGRSWLWHFALDYRLAQFVQSTISYDGRSEGGFSPVHTAKAEVRAFF